MTPTPTGRVTPTSSGLDLTLPRTFHAPIEDVWASITEPERTARWFGPWTGTAAVGSVIEVVMAAEEGEPAMAMTITACDPPHHLGLRAVDDHGTWDVELRLEARGDTTVLTFTHHLSPGTPVGEVGPGWEYYLDRLVASRLGEPLPDFSDYHPALAAWFEDQVEG
jgi:uncharacterized protein YndB with AHSA1/START domain